MADPIPELDHFVAALRHAHAGRLPDARRELFICGDLEEWDGWAAGFRPRAQWEQLEMWKAA